MAPSATLAMLLVLSAASLVHGEPFAEPLVLTRDNFTSTIEVEGSKVLVQFYAPWCSYCKALVPSWKGAAKQVADVAAEDAEFIGQMAIVDAIEEKELANRFRVKSYPTLRWFVDGEERAYRSGQSAGDIADWVISRGGRNVRRLENTTAAE
eukprot:604092-Prymnesium_polylepis.1